MADSSYLYPSDPKELIRYLDNRWADGVKFRAASDLKAFWNIAFYHGYQWLYETSGRNERQLSRIPVGEDDPNAPVMLTINKVASYVDRAIAEITAETPGIECRPGSDEDSDINAAQVGTRISASEDQRMGLQNFMPRLYTWVVPAGYAFVQVTWNSGSGQKVGEVATPENMVKELFEGNVEWDIATHADVVLDPMCTDAWDARWGIRQSALTLSEIHERWQITVEKPIGLNILTDQLDRLGSDGPYNQAVERVAVRQFWLRPGMSRQHPNGLVITWCGQTILEYKTTWPYERCNRLPLIQFNYLPPQGGYMGRTPVSNLIDPQIDYNRARSLEADISSRLLPKVFYQDNSIDPDEVSARVEWIPFMSGSQPPVAWTFDPGWMQQHEIIQKRAEAEMDDAMHQSEASRGQAAGTSPAAGIMAAQQAAAKPYTIPAKEMARALEHFGWVRLMLIRQYWKEERMVRTWSRAGTLSVERFKAADVEGELDVQVKAESIVPRSKAAQAQLALQFMQAKVPGFDLRHFVRMIDLPGTDILTEIFDADERQAERENQYLATKGKNAPPAPTDENDQQAHHEWVAELTKMIPWVHPRDNHQIHIETHRLHMISSEFETYSDKVKALFEAHISTHETVLATRQQAQMQAMAPPQTPQGPPQGPQNGQVPSIEELAGMQGGPGGGMMQPGVPPGISPDQAAQAIGR